MEAWGWLVVYAVGLALFQLLVYRYLWDRDDPVAAKGVFLGHEEEGTEGTPRRSTDPRLRRFDIPKQHCSDPNNCRCPYCGEENERGFTYCWNCVSPLG